MLVPSPVGTNLGQAGMHSQGLAAQLLHLWREFATVVSPSWVDTQGAHPQGPHEDLKNGIHRVVLHDELLPKSTKRALAAWSLQQGS